MVEFKVKAVQYTRNFMVYMGASLIPMLISIIINPLIALNMSPEDYAVSGYYLSFNSLISPLIGFYFIGYYTKEYFKVNETERDELYALVFKGLIYISLILAVVCFGGLYAYMHLFGIEKNIPVMPYLALSVFTLPLGGIYSLKLARGRIERKADVVFGYTVISSLIGAAMTLLLVVVLKLGALGKLMAPFAVSLLFFIFIMLISSDTLKVKVPVKKYLVLMGFCAPLVAGAMMEYFTTGFTTTYLESLGDTREYGIYVVGTSIAGYIMGFAIVVNSVFHPDIIQNAAEGNTRRLMAYFLLEFGVVAAVVAIMILIAPFVVGVLTAGRYVEAVPYARIISLAAITSTVYYLFNDISIVCNHKYHYLITTLVGSIAIVLLMRVVTNHGGYIGGAWMRGLSYLILAAINCVLLAGARGKRILER